MLSGQLAGADVLLREAIQASDQSGSDGWVTLSAVGTALRRLRPEWDVRTYEIKKNDGLKGLFAEPQIMKHFEVKGKHPTSWVRPRSRD